MGVRHIHCFFWCLARHLICHSILSCSARMKPEDISQLQLQPRPACQSWNEVIPFHHPFSSGSSGSSVIPSGPTAAHQASLCITNSWSLLKLKSIELVMPSNHLIPCHPLLLLSSIFPSIRVFSDESVLQIRWPEYQSFSYNITPSNEYSGLISFRMDLLAVQGTLKSPLQHHSSKASILHAQLSLQSNSHIHT